MNRRFFPLFYSSLFRATPAVFVLLLATCGGKQTAPPPTSSAGTGSISFAVEWEPPPASPASATGKAYSVKPMAPAIDVCSDYGIANMTMQVLSGQTVLAETSVPCENHGASLSNVPADNNLTLHIVGSVQGVGNVWNGYSSPFNLAASENKNVGKVTMSYTGNDTTPPTILSVSPADNATNVPDNSAIRIVFSERMATNTVSDNDAIVLIDNTSKRIAGTITYNPLDYSVEFLPQTPLPSGPTYRATVNGSVTDITGKPLGDSFSWSFSVHKKGSWWNPEKISSGVGNAPSVGIDNSGNAIAVWAQNGVVYSSRCNVAVGTWGSPERIDTATLNVSTPQVGVNAIGDALVVMSEEIVANTFRIHANRYSAATGSWGTIIQIDNNTSAYSSSPRVTMNANGIAFAVWSNSQSILYANRYLGGSWEFPVRIDGGITANSFAVAVDIGGNAFVVWDAGNKIYANRYSITNKSWGVPVPIDNAAVTAYNSDVAMDSSGNAVAVWDHGDGVSMRVYANRYSITTGSWGTPIQIGSHGAEWPRVAMDSSGNAIAVWPGNGWKVYANRFDSRIGTWGVETEIGGGTRGYWPHIAMDASGNAVAIWEGNYANRFTAATGSWGTAVGISNGFGGDLNDIGYGGSNIAMDPNGRAVAVWARRNDGIYANWTD